MPIYEYKCEQCGTIEEVLQKISDDPLTTCGHCSGRLQKLISNSTFHLKGSGWYVTDYAQKAKSGTSSVPSQSSTSEAKSSVSDGSKASSPEASS